jgi:hypothetical protein
MSLQSGSFDFNPWLRILSQPRPAIRHIIERNPEKYIYLIAGLQGIQHAFDQAREYNMADQFSSPMIIVFLILFGPFFGWLGLLPGSYLLKLTGKLLGGKARVIEIRSAMAWAAVPMVFNLALIVVQLSVFGFDVFSEILDMQNLSIRQWFFFLPLLLIEITAGVWSLYLFFVTNSEVQGYSVTRAVVSAVLSLLLVSVPLVLVILLFTPGY